jgi:2-iminobutanoate/2-iminopropanoate deaminase
MPDPDMRKRIVESRGAPAAVGAYSPGIRVGDFLFLSGQIPLHPETGVLVEGGVEAQTRRVLENLSALLSAGGAAFEDVVKTTVYLTDIGDFQAFNAVYTEYFSRQPPARATVAVAGLPRGARIEMDAIALVGSGADEPGPVPATGSGAS